MFRFPEVFVKPAPERKVRLAGRGIVPEEGMIVPRNFLVEKLISIGDLVVVEFPEVSVKPAPGHTVQFANGEIVPEEGMTVVRHPIVDKWINDGRLLVVETQKTASPDAPAEDTAAPAAITHSSEG